MMVRRSSSASAGRRFLVTAGGILHKAKLLGALAMSDFDKVIASFNGLAQPNSAIQRLPLVRS